MTVRSKADSIELRRLAAVLVLGQMYVAAARKAFAKGDDANAASELRSAAERFTDVGAGYSAMAETLTAKETK